VSPIQYPEHLSSLWMSFKWQRPLCDEPTYINRKHEIQCGFWSCGHAELSNVCGRHRFATHHLGFFLIFRQRFLFFIFCGESSPICGKIN
jgi:hypothetical protein